MIIGYSVNSLLEEQRLRSLATLDASVYRPHFKMVTLPHPAASTGFQAPTRADPDSRWMSVSQLPAWCGSAGTGPGRRPA